jgi:hypothetical protein
MRGTKEQTPHHQFVQSEFLVPVPVHYFHFKKSKPLYPTVSLPAIALNCGKGKGENKSFPLYQISHHPLVNYLLFSSFLVFLSSVV